MADAMQPTVATPAAAEPSRWLSRARVLALLPFLIAAVALGLRLQGVDWDNGHFFHPDERSIYLRADHMYRTLTDAPGWEVDANRDFPLDTPGIPGVRTFFDKDASPLNPHWFPLGTIIIYILVAVRGLLLEPFMDQVRLQDLASAGRTIAAIVDTGSVLMLYFLGRRLYGPAVGLLASTLGALTVINIQLAHFYRPESFIILLALGSFWWMLNVLERGRLRDHVGLAVMIGLSFAFRASGAPLLIPVFAVYGILAWRRWNFERGMVPGVGLAVVAVQALAAGALAFSIFAFLQPYALLDYRQFFGNLAWEAKIAQHAGDVPYTVQYVGAARNGLYEIRQTAVWALGLPLGVVAWTGLATSIVMAFFRPRTGGAAAAGLGRAAVPHRRHVRGQVPPLHRARASGAGAAGQPMDDSGLRMGKAPLTGAAHVGRRAHRLRRCGDGLVRGRIHRHLPGGPSGHAGLGLAECASAARGSHSHRQPLG